jgi:hypothetical protein
MAELSKARTVLKSSSTGIGGSNPARSKDIGPHFLFVFCCPVWGKHLAIAPSAVTRCLKDSSLQN